MHYKWNKRVLASSFAVLAALATSLNAIPKSSCEKEMDVCCDNPKPGPFGFAYPKDSALSCPRDFFVHVDGLAMQAKQSGMEFTVVDTNTTTSPDAPLNGNVRGFSGESSNWGYQPGLRLGFGFILDHDAWEVDFDWTWLNITEYKHVNSNPGNTNQLPLWVLGTDTPTAVSNGHTSSASWKVHFNMLDFSLGKGYHVSRYLVFTPHFGFRAGWIDQYFSVDYGASGPSTRTIHHGKNLSWGVGGRAGIDSEWILGKGWCLFANFSASMIASKFKIEQSMLLSSGDGFDLDYDFYQNMPNMDMAFGLGWFIYFDHNKYRFSAKAGYEFSQWWNQLNMRRFVSGTPEYANDVVSRGDLSMNGFSLRLALDI